MTLLVLTPYTIIIITITIINIICYIIVARLSHRGPSTGRYSFLRPAQPCRGSGLTLANRAHPLIHVIIKVKVKVKFTLEQVM
jgi:hypothetical protein